MKRYFFIMALFATLASTTGCAQNQKKDKKGKVSSETSLDVKEQRVIIETSMGNIVIKLYDGTPLHRDNFLKLAESGFYDELIFHRVINNFMIQGGDPESKNAEPNKMLGSGDPGYLIDAEIVYPKYFHKKGALAAARTNNPQKKSSGSQFYIVQGKVYTNEEVDMMEQSVINQKTQTIMRKYMEPHREVYMRLQQTGDSEGMKKLQEEVMKEASGELELIEAFKIPEEVRTAYTTIGGTPHLDDAYTVFGEVVEGLDVIDKIAAVETNGQDRPLQNVVMKMKVVTK